MAQANRHYIPGCIWHITHRCHKKEFLLKFAHDRCRFVYWLGEARKRFGVHILNYTVTSNHVHLLVKETGTSDCIPSANQLVAGRTGQEYNQRKRRKGAFWEDRYHATAIESGEHLRRCLVYLDLNPVRAGAARHPAEWAHGGYHEIQGTRRRNRILALDALAEAVEVDSVEVLSDWLEDVLSSKVPQREEAWTKCLAVGSEEFVSDTRTRLGARGKGREVVGADDFFVLRESAARFWGIFSPENRPIASKNSYYWDDIL